MNRWIRILGFLLVASLILLWLFVVLWLYLSREEALKITGIMVVPSLWATRLLLAYRRGTITRRLNFRSRSLSVSIARPPVLNRRVSFWRFHGYFLKETFFCGILWLLILGNTVLPRLLPDREAFRPPTEPAVSMPAISPVEANLPPFRAVHHVPVSRHRLSASVFEFVDGQPVAGTGFPVETGTYPLKQIAVDAERSRIYGITTHRFGEVILETGEFEEIPVNEDLPELSWPSGIALDLTRRILIVLGRGANFVYFPDADAWRALNGLDRLAFHAVAYDPGTDAFLGLVNDFGAKRMNTLAAFSADGAILSRRDLSPPIPCDSYADPPVQLIAAGDSLIVLISSHMARAGTREGKVVEARLFRVDAGSGAVEEVVEAVPEKETPAQPGESMERPPGSEAEIGDADSVRR